MVDQCASQANSKAQAVSGPVPEKNSSSFSLAQWAVFCVQGSHSFFPTPSESHGEALVHEPQTILTMKMFFLAQLAVCVSNFNNVK